MRRTIFMAQRNLRLSDEVVQRIGEAVRKDHYPSASSFIRSAIEAKLGNPKDAVDEAEPRIAGSLETIIRLLQRLEAALQAQFALIDALARLFLFCTTDPPLQLHDQAKAQARERHKQFLRMAALNMKGDTSLLLQELVSHGE
jgi:Arc/MetJ-type ribon-helix-helix transcriptional regulator